MSLLRNILAKIAIAIGGAFKTKNDRVNTINKFVDRLRSKNININAVEHIKAKYIIDYVEMRKKDGLRIRNQCPRLFC